jgi:hypothetical protein
MLQKFISTLLWYLQGAQKKERRIVCTEDFIHKKQRKEEEGRLLKWVNGGLIRLGFVGM